MSDIKVSRYGRSWFTAYDAAGRFLAMGRTRGEALRKAAQAIEAGGAL